MADELAERGFAAAAVHGDLGQGAREQALRAFRNGKVDVLVATDVAARGIDVEDVTHVINYQCPEDEKTYLHRIGRTARAGNTGIAVTFVDWDDMPRWALINKALDLGIPEPAGDLLLLRPPLRASSTSREGTKGRLPQAAQTRAGLGAEELEDLGETGKSAGGASPPPAAVAAAGRAPRRGPGRLRAARRGRGERGSEGRSTGHAEGGDRQAAPQPQPPPHARWPGGGRRPAGLTLPTTTYAAWPLTGATRHTCVWAWHSSARQDAPVSLPGWSRCR